MAFDNNFTAVTGATYTASQYNTYTRDNLDAIWVYTTAGDIVYASGSTTLSRLAIGANGSFLESTGSAPQWTKIYKSVFIPLNFDLALQTGDNAGFVRIPAHLNGYNLSAVAACRQSGTGVVTLQVRNATVGQDMLSTALTIDSGETDSLTAATPAVINGTYDNVSTGDQIYIDVDGAGTTTYYCGVELVFSKP